MNGNVQIGFEYFFIKMYDKIWITKFHVLIFLSNTILPKKQFCSQV
jgi:hypothetical protein